MKLSIALIAALGLACWLGFPRAVRADDDRALRNVAPFERITLSGAFSCTISAGAPSQSVILEGDRDALSGITTDVRGRTLSIGVRPGVRYRRMHVEIALPTLRAFRNDGASSTTIRGLTGGDLELANAGAGQIVAAGRAADEVISLSGTGAIHASDVQARNVTAEADGVGSITLRGTGHLRLRVNGVGSIRYAGSPASVDKEVSGVGSIGPM